MVALLCSIHHLLLFLVLVQSVSLYRIYASDNSPSVLLSDSLTSSYDKELNQASPLTNVGYDDDYSDFSTNSDDTNDNLLPWLSMMPSMRHHEKFSTKRSIFPFKFRSTKDSLQRRNNRPHWNPLVAAYKRCGELLTNEDRESCFKDAIQRLFVFKLRK